MAETGPGDGGADFEASPEQVHATASRISEWADELWNDVAAVAGKASSLLSAGWRGDAANTHREAWTDWEDGARRIAAALSGDAALLHQAASAFAEADQA